MNESEFDIFIVGGGINGCGIARDAAGRGYSVCLAEMNDLGSGTSSGSTKLIHGGLRYLEHYEFKLVREALMEREVLWGMAPHIIWPMRFVLPHHKGLRPAWLLRLGLFLYDHIGGRKKLPATRTLDLRTNEAGKPLRQGLERGFEYSDCWVNDARLVVLNAMDAADRGASIRTRTRLVAAHRADGIWRLTTEDANTGERQEMTARMVVNAAGPWVDHVLSEALGRNAAHNVRLVKGSHIVVRRHFTHDRSYIFQNADGRVIFAIPYERDFTLIGTTDRDHEGDPKDAAITQDEVDYLCGAVSEYFAEPVGPGDVVWTYSGVRPLFDDGASEAQEATREYVLRLADEGGAPVLNVFGGKITTFRRLAEAALGRIEKTIGAKGPAWTRGATLPGGDFPAEAFAQTLERFHARYAFLSEALAHRLVRQYGTRADEVIGPARSADDLGRHFKAGLHACEVDYLMDREWARSAADILWRRTKLGLHFSDEAVAALETYMQQRRAGTGAG